jgi:hypothetical protein
VINFSDKDFDNSNDAISFYKINDEKSDIKIPSIRKGGKYSETLFTGEKNCYDISYDWQINEPNIILSIKNILNKPVEIATRNVTSYFNDGHFNVFTTANGNGSIIKNTGLKVIVNPTGEAVPDPEKLFSIKMYGFSASGYELESIGFLIKNV